MPGGDEVRAAQRATWAGLSASWDKWDALIMVQLAPVGTAIVDSLGVAADQQHLDIAAGTGEPGLSVARLAPHGLVVLSDLSPEMLGVAVRRAAAAGLASVEIAVCSADALPFGDGVFDSISVRFGYMFFPDMAQATAEFARVLKPGGRLAASVWISPEDNPWTSIPMQAVGAEVALPAPDPDRPSMFRCAAPGLVSAMYAGAGLHDIAEWDVAIELVTETPEQYWEMIADHVSLVSAAMAQIDAAARERVRDEVVAQARGYERDGAVRVPGLARCIAGTRR